MMQEPSPGRLLERMTWEDLLGWLVFYQDEPWGPWCDDLRAGVIASAALAPYSKNPPTPASFFPSLRRLAESKKSADGWISGPDMKLALQMACS